MNPQEINKRIAIACGKPHPSDTWRGNLTCPNYHGDLNAMHKAEKGMENNQWWDFVAHLTDICGGGTPLGISSTAAQRAEAFLRAIGQWEEDK
jgi:hypothetical protein